MPEPMSPKYPVFLDEEKHRYTVMVNGVAVPMPGVSEIMQNLGLSKDYSRVDTFYRDRGIAGHKCIEFYLKGVLDESTVDESVRAHFEQFKNWWEANKRPILGQEIHLFSAKYNFCGTLDLILAADRGFPDQIHDFKFSKDPDLWAATLQGSAYRTLWIENFGSYPPFSVLKINESGCVPIDLECHETNWASVMQLYRAKRRANAGTYKAGESARRDSGAVETTGAGA